MRIAQLTLRDNALNKRYAMRFIAPLQQDIAHGDVARASEALREVSVTSVTSVTLHGRPRRCERCLLHPLHLLRGMGVRDAARGVRG